MPRRALPLLAAAAVVALAALGACGAATATGPLHVPLGLAEPDLTRELRRHEYCPGEATGRDARIYPRCKVPGVEHGQSWVVAQLRGGRAVRLQRWERYDEPARGLARFNELIEKRTARDGAPTQDAKDLIAAQQELPAGTRTWVAFRTGEHTLVGIYLLDPRPPERATVLEEVVELGLETAPRARPGRGCPDCATAD